MLIKANKTNSEDLFFPRLPEE